MNNQNQNYPQQGNQQQGQQQNYVAPQGQITGEVHAPAGGNQKVRRKDIMNLPQGLNPGVVFAIVDLGTQMESYQGQPPSPKRKIYIGFEHPQLKQLFYEDDTDRKSTMTSKECTYSIGDKSFLKQLMNAIAGRQLTYQEAQGFNIVKLLGTRVGVQTVQARSKSDPSRVYDKVAGIMTWNMALPPDFNPENKKWFFIIDKDPQGNVIGNNFKTENYAMLPSFLKKKILASQEAQDYMARGGQFAKMPEQNNNQNQGQQQNYQGNQPQQNQGDYQQSQQNFQQGNQQNPTQQNFQQQPQQNNGNFQQGNQQSGQPQQQQQFNQNQGQQPQQNNGDWSPNDNDDDLPF